MDVGFAEGNDLTEMLLVAVVGEGEAVDAKVVLPLDKEAADWLKCQ